MSEKGIEVVFGGGPIGNYPSFTEDHELDTVFGILEKHNVKKIDSAQIYGESEKRLGEVNAGKRFTIDTKWPGGMSGPWMNRDNIINTARESIKKLGVDKVDIFYVHTPDTAADLGEMVKAINDVHKEGLFSRFGLSNFTAEQVEAVYNHAKENEYILPTVYQGNYNPVARKMEDNLFPTLRKFNIAFYAYSPLAGGFLTKTRQQISDGAGRFNNEVLGGMYNTMYAKPLLLDALDKWEDAANEAGCPRAELAYRWVSYNAALSPKYGDAIIVGARDEKQLEQTLQGLEKGPLPDSVVKKIDAIWDEIKSEAPGHNTDYIKPDMIKPESIKALRNIDVASK